MRKLKTLIAALCLCAVCALCVAPAHALEYTISAPGSPEYGKPTSFEPMVTADGGPIKNEDLSKNAALIPPGFGTPTSYLPGSGVYLTPNLAASQMAGAGTVNGSAATVTPPSIGVAYGGAGSYPSSGASFSTAPSAAVGFTEVTGSMYYSGGYLAVLKIPSLNVNVKVYQGTDNDALAKGAGLFENTSIWSGNVCVAGHNRGVNCYFGDIHTLNAGDTITLTTRLGTRTYAVSSVTKVSVNDVSGLRPSATNMVTLYTCVRDQPDYRWCVTAVEI